MSNIVQYWTLLFDPKKDRFLDPSLLIEMLRCKTIKNKVVSLDWNLRNIDSIQQDVNQNHDNFCTRVFDIL